jgi:hypothetical protein
MVCSLPLVARVGLPVSSGFSNRQVSFCKTPGETPVENPAFTRRFTKKQLHKNNKKEK